MTELLVTWWPPLEWDGGLFSSDIKLVVCTGSAVNVRGGFIRHFFCDLSVSTGKLKHA